MWQVNVRVPSPHHQVIQAVRNPRLKNNALGKDVQ